MSCCCNSSRHVASAFHASPGGASAFAMPAFALTRTLRANAKSLSRNHKSAILLWLGGGPPTIDMWDMKPGAPTAGQFKPIATTGDLQICELMPQLAKQMKHLSIVRSMSIPGSKYPYAPDRPYTPPDAPLEDFRALHAKLGVGRAVIVNASVHGTDNRVALDAIAASGGAYRAVANLDDTISERGLRELHEGGFRGCRFNFVRHLGGVPDKRMFERVIDRVAPLGWHIDLHFDAIDLPEYAGMLARLPLRYTIDHMGRVKAADGLDQLPFRTLIELMQRDEKCFVKVCGCERVSSPGRPLPTRCRSRAGLSRPRRIASSGAQIGRIPTSR